MKKLSTKINYAHKSLLKLSMFIGLFVGSILNAQVLVPSTGSNVIACGTSTVLRDHSNYTGYSNNVYGYTVIHGGFQGVVAITGPYALESGWDYVYVYDGVGTGGTLLTTLNGFSTWNYTTTPGQTITIAFDSDGSVTYQGFSFTLTSTGPCFATPCNSVPGANTVVTSPTVPVCPGTSAFLSLANSYTVGNITYQWLSSTSSSVGPFTAISGATLNSYTTPTLNANQYYSVVIQCANATGSAVVTSTQVMVAPVVTSTVPYYESFEGIIGNDKLPNCSWNASALGSICKTYTSTMNQNRSARTGSKYATFYAYYITGSNYYYTNGIQLYPGVTYSAALWYKTENYGYTNVTDLRIMYGPNQSPTGLTTIVSTNGPATSALYAPLSNTFTVASAGIYYVAVKATSSGNYGTYYLTWDDLEITIPCSLNPISVGLSSTSNTICSGDAANFTATGADIYSWNNGATGSAMSDYPTSNFVYEVVGTNTLTGCTSTVSQLISVNPSPFVIVFADKITTCSGDPVKLTGLGAGTYTWSVPNNANNQMITVNPTVTTSYTLIGSNSYNCSTSVVQQINVNPKPNISVSVNPADAAIKICKGETATLMGSGATTYSFASSSLFVQGSQAQVTPNGTTTYSITGADVNGCTGVTTYVQNVDACTGIKENASALNGLNIYPNPATGIFTVELKNSSSKTISVIDLTGRVVYTTTSSSDKVNVNITALAAGVYYVKVQADNASETVKLVKE